MEKWIHYRLIAGLFQYPDAAYPHRVRDIKSFLDRTYPGAAVELGRFLELLPVHDLRAMQELFTRSFDVQAITTLDIGYVLFGDDYKRGELLANLNREHLEAKNNCGTELADHLPNLLRLMGKLRDEELVRELVEVILAPALREMIGEFSTERVEKKNESYEKHYRTLIEAPEVRKEAVTLYGLTLKALYGVLKQDFSLVEETVQLKPTDKFLQSVRIENEIEDRAQVVN